MVSSWPQFPADIPADRQRIWCRIDRWSGRPFLGTYFAQLQGVIAENTGLVYPFWTVSAWRPVDAADPAPAYPVTGITLPNSVSNIANYTTTNTTWRLYWTKQAPEIISANYRVFFSVAYASGSGPQPPDTAFSFEFPMQMMDSATAGRMTALGQEVTNYLRLPLQNMIPQAGRVVIAGHRMWIRYRFLHLPTNFYFPYFYESVQVA